jgi:hypothetical protein
MFSWLRRFFVSSSVNKTAHATSKGSKKNGSGANAQPRNYDINKGTKNLKMESQNNAGVFSYAPTPLSITSLIKDISLMHPPGIAGDICNEMVEFEFRELASLRPIVPIMILSTIASELPKGRFKYNVYSIVTAPSAAGKEAHQSYLKSVLNKLGYERHVHEAPRSDKAIILDLLYAAATSAYIMDEGHVLFRSSFAAKASNYEKNMADLLMQLKTANSFKLTGNLKRDLEESLRPRIEKLTSRKKLDEETTNQLQELKALYALLSEPIQSPHLSMISYSTPSSVRFMFTEQGIATGFLGRFIYLRSGEKRAVLRYKDPSSLLEASKPIEASDGIISRLQNIKTIVPPTFNSEAKMFLTEVTKYLDSDAIRNHPILGAIFARGAEQILVISTLLALEEGIVTRQMVGYSFKLFMNSIDECCNYLNAKEQGEANALTQIVEEKVFQYSKKHGAASIAVIRNHIEKCSSAIRTKVCVDRDFLKKTLADMADAEMLVEVEPKSFIHAEFAENQNRSSV